MCRTIGIQSIARITSTALLSIALVVSFARAVGAGQESPMSSESPSSQSNADPLRNVLQKMRTGQKIEAAEFHASVQAQNDGLKTGPEVGAKVPEFELSDENGKAWKLGDLVGLRASCWCSPAARIGDPTAARSSSSCKSRWRT